MARALILLLAFGCGGSGEGPGADTDALVLDSHLIVPTTQAPPGDPSINALALVAPLRFVSGADVSACLTLDEGARLEPCGTVEGQVLAWDSGRLAVDWDCFQAGYEVGLSPCAEVEVQRWTFTEAGQLVGIGADATHSCLSATPSGAVEFAACEAGKLTQRWALEPAHVEVDLEAIAGGLVTLDVTAQLAPVGAVHGTAVPLLRTAEGVTVAAAGGVGQGRAAVLGGARALEDVALGSEYAAWVYRLTAWLGGREDPMVALAPSASSARIRALFEEAGWTVVVARATELGDADVWVTGFEEVSFPVEEAREAERFLERGGGVLAFSPSWGERQVAVHPPVDHTPTRVVGPAGIGWAEGQPVASSSLEVVRTVPPTRTVSERVRAAASGARTAAVDAYARDATAWVVTHPHSVLQLARDVLVGQRGAPAIGPTQPHVWGADPVADLLVQADYVLWRTLPDDRIVKHPSAALWPGSVPASAPRDLHSRQLDLQGDPSAGTRWIHTGLYAPAGERIVVGLPAHAIGEGIRVRIGDAVDNIFPGVTPDAPATLGRFPHTTRGLSLDELTSSLVSPFGGLVLIEVPADSAAGSARVLFDGVIEAPWFDAELHDSADWLILRESAAPRGVFTSAELSISAVASLITATDDPVPVLSALGELVRAHAAFTGADASLAEGTEVGPQVVVIDAASPELLRAGRPIALGSDSGPALLQGPPDWSSSAGWALDRALGLNFQQEAWTLPVWTSSTADLAAVYALEHGLGLPWTAGLQGHLEPELRASRAEAFVRSGAPWSEQGALEGLEFWLMLVDGFGWQPVRGLVRDLRADRVPRMYSDQGTIELLADELSHRVGRNLSPYFSAWGFELPAGLRNDLALLPGWSGDPTAPWRH